MAKVNYGKQNQNDFTLIIRIKTLEIKRFITTRFYQLRVPLRHPRKQTTQNFYAAAYPQSPSAPRTFWDFDYAPWRMVKYSLSVTN